jgi:hypothetical protein
MLRNKSTKIISELGKYFSSDKKNYFIYIEIIFEF